MKLVYALFLIALISLHLSSVTVLYYMGLSEVKKEIEVSMGNLENTVQLTIACKDFDNPGIVEQVEENEILYKGSMYDIMSKKKAGNNWVITAIEDNKELALNQALKETINCFDKDGTANRKNSKGSAKMDEVFMANKLMAFCYIIPSKTNLPVFKTRQYVLTDFVQHDIHPPEPTC